MWGTKQQPNVVVGKLKQLRRSQDSWHFEHWVDEPNKTIYSRQYLTHFVAASDGEGSALPGV